MEKLMIMDEVDLWSIQSLIEFKTGSSGRPYVPDEDPNIFLDYVVQTVPTIRMPQQRRFNVFSVDHGVPDLFTLIGYSQPVICYHVGYVGKFIKFRNYIMEDPDKHRIDHHGIANLFELLSALYMQAGNCAFATTCLLQSIIETPFQTTDKEVYDGSNYELHSSFHHSRSIEASFTLLYFGLTHEIGHTYADDCLQTGTKVHSREITDKAIAQAVVESAKRVFKEIAPNSDYMFNCWHESYLVASKDKGSVLHCDNLRSEILADNLGFNILITSLNSLARYGNQKPNFKIIASEVIIGLFVVQLMEACKYLVKALPAEQSNPELGSRYFPIPVNDAPLHARLNAEQMIQDFQIAHAVRWEFLKPSLASLAIMHLFPDIWSIKGRTVVANCSASELTRREAIAVSNVEGYLSYYTKEMLKLQARLGDVVHFVGHMVTGKASEHRTRQPADVTFGDQIAGNFRTYLSRLTENAGAERKQEIFAQLTEYKTLLRRRGKEGDLRDVERILHQLESDLNNHEK